MISTWGIFWICFFGGWLLATLIREICRTIRGYRLPKLTEEQKQKGREWVEKLVKILGENITVNHVSCDCKETKSKKTKKAVNKD